MCYLVRVSLNAHNPPREIREVPGQLNSTLAGEQRCTSWPDDHLGRAKHSARWIGEGINIRYLGKSTTYLWRPTMATITRKHNKIALLLAGVVVMECDTLQEAQEWMEVLGLTYTLQYV